jgi:carbon storage regulator
MLTLTRKLGQRIHVGDDVVVEVLSISGGIVKLGVRAPRRVAVHRGELLDGARAENRAAPRAVETSEESRIRDASRVLRFDRGLYGFEHEKEWVLCELAESLPVLAGHDARVLVARNDPSLRLVVLDLELLLPDYPFDRADAAANHEDPRFADEPLAHAVVVRVNGDGDLARVNLAAPLVIGVRSLRGRQVLLDGLPLDAPFGHDERAATELVDEAHP